MNLSNNIILLQWTLTYENLIIRKIQNMKRASKKFPSHLTKNIQDVKTKMQINSPTETFPEFIS